MSNATVQTQRYSWPPKEYRIWQHNHDYHKACIDKPFVWFCGGVGSGKSVAGYVQDLYNATALYPGATGFLGLPDWRVYEEVVIPRLERWWPPKPFWVDKPTKHGRNILVSAPGGKVSKIIIRVAMNRQTVDRWVGFDASWAHFEEPSAWRDGKRAFMMGLARLRESPDARVHLTGTPGGFNWIADVWGVTEELPDHAWTHGVETKPGYFVRCVKTDWNKANPPNFYPMLVEAYGEEYAKEQLRGAILASEGRVFPEFFTSVNMIPRKIAQYLFDLTTHRTGGVDWGFRDEAAIIWGGWDGDGNKICPPGSEWYKRGVGHLQQGVEAQRVQRKFGVSEWYCDPAGKDERHDWGYGYSTAEGIKVKIHGCKMGQKDWVPRRNAIGQLLKLWGVGRLDHPAKPRGNRLGRPGIMFSEDMVHVAEEFRKYRWKDAKPGEETQAEMAVGPDHLIDGLGYDVLAKQRRYNVKPTVAS